MNTQIKKLVVLATALKAAKEEMERATEAWWAADEAARAEARRGWEGPAYEAAHAAYYATRAEYHAACGCVRDAVDAYHDQVAVVGDQDPRGWSQVEAEAVAGAAICPTSLYQAAVRRVLWFQEAPARKAAALANLQQSRQTELLLLLAGAAVFRQIGVAARLDDGRRFGPWPLGKACFGTLENPEILGGVYRPGYNWGCVELADGTSFPIGRRINMLRKQHDYLNQAWEQGWNEGGEIAARWLERHGR